jgi:hypothetical protein
LGQPQAFQVPSFDLDLRQNLRSSALVLGQAIRPLEGVHREIIPDSDLPNVYVEGIGDISLHRFLMLLWSDHFTLFHRISRTFEQEKLYYQTHGDWEYGFFLEDEYMTQLSRRKGGQTVFLNYQQLSPFLYLRLWKDQEEIVGLLSYEHERMEKRIHISFSYSRQQTHGYFLDWNFQEEENLFFTQQGRSPLRHRRYTPLFKNNVYRMLDDLSDMKTNLLKIFSKEEIYEKE